MLQKFSQTLNNNNCTNVIVEMVRKPSKKPSLEWNHINEIIMQENAVNERHL